MRIVRAIWLPSVAMIVAAVALGLAGIRALGRIFSGEITEHWLVDTVWPSYLMLAIICAAAFWSGYRLSCNNRSFLRFAIAGIAMPVIFVIFFLVVGWVESGQSSIDELFERRAAAGLVVAIAAAAASCIVGGFANRKASV